MMHADFDDVKPNEVARACSGPLGASSFQFAPLWSEVDSICDAVLSWYSSPDFKGQRALQQLVRAYTIVYRLVSSTCGGCPQLVTASGEQHIAPNTEGTQSLVVYHLFCDMIRKRLTNVVEERFRKVVDAPCPLLLETYITEWKRFIIAVNMLKVVFSYLHGPWQKYGVPLGQVIHSTEVIALNKWSEMLASSSFQGALTGQVFELVEMDRNHHPDEGRAQILREIGHALGVVSDPRSNWYVTMIEDRYLQQLTDFCRHRAEETKVMGVEHYIEQALILFSDETERANRLLTRNSIQPVIQRIAEVLINDELPFLDEYISSEIIENREPQLRRMYSLLSKSQIGLKQLKEKFKGCVVAKGQNVISEACKSAKESNGDVYRVALEKVISVYRDFVSPVEAFGGNGTFERELIDGLHSVLTNCPYIDSKCALSVEVARYAHNELNNLKLEACCEEDEGDMESIIILFRVLPTKAFFVEAYPSFLCSRLLSAAYNVENERHLIRELYRTRECTNDFMHKCTTMLNDMDEVSKSLSKRFGEMFETVSESVGDFEFHPIVLTSYSWPNFPPEPEIAIPEPLQNKLLQFKLFFREVCPKRHITYVNKLSRGILRLNLPRDSSVQSLDICIGVQHLKIADMFNIRTEWELEELMENVEKGNSAIYLHAINDFAKHGILDIREGASGEVISHLHAVLPRCCISLGCEPNAKEGRITLHEIKLDKETKLHGMGPSDFSSERYDTNTITEQMVSLSTQAMLIRAFKSEGTVSFSQLLEKAENESPPHLRPSLQQIKAALEFLINREFVRRSEDGTDMFSYIT